MAMRLAFMGSPEFSVPTLRALHDAGHDIAAVYCQPPRPAGRGQEVRRCPVHVAADALGLPVRTPAKLRRDTAEHEAFAALKLDVAVVAAYGLILPREILDAPHRGCLNIHASLLPRWRGAAPIQAAILAGDAESGVTIMQMDPGLDTGPMLLREAVTLDPHCTANWLHDRLSEIGPRLILRVLDEWPAPIIQPETGVTYAAKLTREDGRLDWHKDAISLDRQVRALNPWPGTFCLLGSDILKVLAAEPAFGEAPPGTVLDDDLTIACGDGAVRLTRVQRAGRGAQPTEAFLRGHKVPIGTVLS